MIPALALLVAFGGTPAPAPAAPPPPPPAELLATAEAHLKADKIDDVLFTLENQKFEGEQAKRAAQILARAGKRALQQKDPVMGIQFGQMAVKHDETLPLAHEVLARSYKSQEQFGPAEQHADRWISSTQEQETNDLDGLLAEIARARLFRAQLALEQGDWGLARGLAEGLKGAPLERADQRLAELIRTQAKKEMKDRTSALGNARSLEAKMEKALEDAKKMGARPMHVAGSGASSKRPDGEDVVVYGTAWCGYCKKTRQWLQSKGIQFVDRDIEKDSGAAEELAEKSARAGVKPTGVPVVDIKGKLILGWSPEAMSKQLNL